jgi:hypothetical protein
MSLTVISNSSDAMCATVQTSSRFFCHGSFDSMQPLYLPINHTYQDLVEADKRIARAAYSANLGNGWVYLQAMMCATEFKPCSTLEPPADSGVCKSLCDTVVRSTKDVYSYNSFAALCADDNFVIDDTKPSHTVVCAGKFSDATAIVARIALVGLVALQTLSLLQ